MIVRELDQLTKLARAIRQHHDDALALVDKARDFGFQAVTEAILAGEKLRTAKRIIGHGRFKSWIAQHCPKISYSTARDYMRIAKRQHAVQMGKATSVRAALALIADTSPRRTSKTAKFRLPLLNQIGSLKPVEQWEAGEREFFERWFTEHVEPVIAIRDRLRQAHSEKIEL
jgi:hypothetical protein